MIWLAKVLVDDLMPEAFLGGLLIVLQNGHGWYEIGLDRAPSPRFNSLIIVFP